MAAFRGQRLVLRTHPGEDEIQGFAAASRWPVVSDTQPAADGSVRRQITWQANDVEVSYLEDDMSPNSFVVVEGTSPSPVSSMSQCERATFTLDSYDAVGVGS